MTRPSNEFPRTDPRHWEALGVTPEEAAGLAFEERTHANTQLLTAAQALYADPALHDETFVPRFVDPDTGEGVESWQRAVEILDAQGERDLANAVLAVAQNEERPYEQQAWAEQRDSLTPSQVQAIRERQRDVATQAAADAVSQGLVEKAIEITKGYGQLSDQVLARTAARIEAGTPVADAADVEKVVEQAGRDVVVATDRLASLTEQARTEFRVKSKTEAKHGPAMTSSDLTNAERIYINARVAQLAAEKPITEAEVAAPPTAAEEAAAQVSRIEANPARTRHDGIRERGQQWEAEQEAKRKSSGGLLAGKFDHAPAPSFHSTDGDTQGTPPTIQELEAQANQPVIRTGYAGSTPGAVVVNESGDRPPGV
jgi:hypothetical protein